MGRQWRQPVNEAERRGLFNGVRDNSLNHPGYTGRTHQNTPPSLRLGLRVACSPLDSVRPSTSEIRRAFLRVLDSPVITQFIAGVTDTSGSTWTSWEGNGRHNLAAVFAEDPEQGAPTAWARILLPDPDPDHASVFRDPLCADFVLHVEPRTHRGEHGPPVNLATWHRRFIDSLDVPDAIATGLLAGDLRLSIGDEPATKIAVWLEGRPDLSALVDITGSRRLRGTQVSPWFSGYAVADGSGDPPAALAVEWIRQMCDDSLYLDGYEPMLLTLGGP
jgi:hypothetical protein